MSEHRTSHLSEAELERLRNVLSRKRDQLLAAQAAGERDRRGITEREIEPNDSGDIAEGIIEQDTALRLAAFDAPLLADVERALAKLEAGTYGLSEDSGTPIPLDRLEAVPWARRTAQEEERRRHGA